MSGNNGTVVSDDHDIGLYGYTPTRGVAYAFVILFLISTVVHGYQLTKYRLWWLIPTVGFGGLFETIAWSGRLWSSYAPLNSLPFKIQTTCASLGPTPFLAANFIILAQIIRALGPVYSRLKPKRYTIIFCSCDVFSILIQGGGGGIAASASTLKGANTGARVMLVGIALQLLFILGYVLCGTEFFIRYKNRRPFPLGGTGDNYRGVLTSDIKTMTSALVLSTIFLIIRSIYRVVELWNGWTGKVLHTEIYFNIFDGGMILLAFFTFNFFHPGKLLAGPFRCEQEGTKLDYVGVNTNEAGA